VGSLEVCEGGKALKEGVNLEEVGKELEDGVVVQLEDEVGGEDEDVRREGSGSLSGSKGGGGFEFLECMEKEGKEEELEKNSWRSRGRGKRQGEAKGPLEYVRVAGEGD
jgi:hypothetical protein